MDKEKAKAAFVKWLESLDTFPAYQYDTMLKAQNAYLAGAEWAWGESLDSKFATAPSYFAMEDRIKKLQAENKELRECVEQCFYHTVMRDPKVNTHADACNTVQEMTRQCLKEIEGEK